VINLGAGFDTLAYRLLQKYKEVNFIEIDHLATHKIKRDALTNVVAPINPKIGNLLKRIGFRMIDKDFFEPHTGVPMLPLVLESSKLNDFFLNFIKLNQFNDFLNDYERWFYKAGELIIEGGTIGQKAFHIIEGKVQARMPGTDHVLGELGEREMFGEVSLLTDEPRSADIVAVTDDGTF